MGQQYGDLAKAVVHDPDEDWPTIIEIVAYFSKDGSRRGKRFAIEIDADQFFGRHGHGAPMSGEQIIAMVDRLRKQSVR